MVELSTDPVTSYLGNSNGNRREAYSDFVRAGMPDAEYTLIRGALRRNQLTGGQGFVDEIEQREKINPAPF